MKIDELMSGQIYVTQGGTVVMLAEVEKVIPGKGVVLKEGSETEVPWGYDRVRFVKVTDTHIIVETPWGTECELPLDYPLVCTTEKVMRCEFPVRGPHKSRKIIPFEEALKMGICKEVNIVQEVPVENSKDAEPVKPKVKAARAKETSKNDLKKALIEYFSEEHTLTEAAKHFKIEYQKIRYNLQDIKNKGFELQRFELKSGKKDGMVTNKLEKV